jgi:hypothetical protein
MNAVAGRCRLGRQVLLAGVTREESTTEYAVDYSENSLWNNRGFETISASSAMDKAITSGPLADNLGYPTF